MPVSPSPPSETVEIAYLERLRDEYGSPTTDTAPLDANPPPSDDLSTKPNHGADSNLLEVEAQQSEEYEFRLFSVPNAAVDASGKDPNVKRIAIRSPSPVNKDPGFVIAERPAGYYFTGHFDQSRKEEFLVAAMSGEEVLGGVDMKWPGCHLPWRVRVVTASPPNCDSDAKKHLEGMTGASGSNGKKRSGKKRRIAIRMKIRAAERSGQEREIAAREKKTRMNRGKKVRRKMKEKAAKLEKGVEGKDIG